MASQRDDINEEILAFTERTMRRLVLRVHQAVTLATPVDTGFARAGWTPSVGKRLTRQQRTGKARPADRATATTLAASLLSTRSKAAVTLSRIYRLTQGRVFISNAVRYVPRLNQGSSAQAPAGFVERAMKQAVRATEIDETDLLL